MNLKLSYLLVAGVFSLWLAAAQAQLASDNPDWKESPVPPPPALDVKKKSLIPVRVSAATQLQWFVDADSISITKDGIVRYVVIAQSDSGTVNAMYEGFRCTKAEVKLYARHSPGQSGSSSAGGWVEQKNSDWLPATRTSYSLALARLGLCDGAAPASSAKAAIQKLTNPVTEPNN